MERITIDQVKRKHFMLQRALKTLEEALHSYQVVLQGDVNMSIIPRDILVKHLRDSLIQRFEYCFDAEWKFLKMYLEAMLGIKMDFIGPSSVLRECFKARLLNESEVTHALKMVEDRNLTSHVYLENIAERVSAVVPDHFELMKKILKKTAVKL